MPHWAFGRLVHGGIRICDCGEITLEYELHICTLGEEMDKNPITELEDKTGMRDMGRMGYLVMQGAKDEGATNEEALTVMIGYFAGIAASNNYTHKEDDEHSN